MLWPCSQVSATPDPRDPWAVVLRQGKSLPAFCADDSGFSVMHSGSLWSRLARCLLQDCPQPHPGDTRPPVRGRPPVVGHPRIQCPGPMQSCILLSRSLCHRCWVVEAAPLAWNSLKCWLGQCLQAHELWANPPPGLLAQQATGTGSGERVRVHTLSLWVSRQ